MPTERDRALLDRLPLLFAPFGAVRTRAMFGGHGVYCEGVFCALVAEGVLYLKTDPSTRGSFEAAGSEPFRPFPDDPERAHVTMAYYPVPPGADAGPETLAPWLALALEAAGRATQKGPKPRRKA